MAPDDVIEDYRLLVSKDPALIDEIVREGEARLKMQVQMALAADARSGAMAAWQAGGAVALIVAATQNLSSGAFAAAIGAAACLMIAAACAAAAAMPVAFGMVGTLPSGWLDSVRDNEPIAEGKAGYAVWLDKYLKLNDSQMAGNNDWLRRSLLAVVLAPIVAGSAAMIFS
jgi:hypothetical protein